MPNALLDALAELKDPDKPNVIDGDYTFVRVVNKSNRVVPMEWNSRKYHVPANGERLVPYFCMAYWCGDPRAVDIPGDMRRRYRTDEWTRLRVLYGVYEFTNDPAYLAHIPELEVFTPSGLRITTVLEDPNGDTLSGLTQELSEADAAREEANLLREQLAKVVARLDRVETQQRTADPLTLPELNESRRTDIPVASPTVQPTSDFDDVILSTDDLNTSSTTIPTKKSSSKA